MMTGEPKRGTDTAGDDVAICPGHSHVISRIVYGMHFLVYLGFEVAVVNNRGYISDFFN